MAFWASLQPQAELGRRETRLIQEAERALEERAKEEAQSKGKPEEKAKPKAQMQYNFIFL